MLVVLVVALAFGLNAISAGAYSGPNHLAETGLSQVPLTDDPSPPTAVPVDGGAAYTIPTGDTLWHLFQLTGVSVVALEARNHFTDPRMLSATLKHRIRESSETYVDGVWALRNQIMARVPPW